MAKRLDMLGSSQTRELNRTGSFTLSTGETYTPTEADRTFTDVSTKSTAQLSKEIRADQDARNAGVIPIDTMENPPGETNLTVPETNPNTEATLAVASDVLSQAEASAAQEAAAKESALTASQEELKNMFTQMGERPAEQMAMENQTQIPQWKEQQNALNRQIKTAAANLTAFQRETPFLVEDMRDTASSRDVTKRTFSAQETRFRRERQLDVIAKTAALEGMIASSEYIQGNIDSATDRIERHLDVKYSAIEAELNFEKEMLRSKESQFTAAQQELANIRQQKLDEQLTVISDAKELVKTVAETGYATPEEIEILTGSDITPEEQDQMATAILARGAGEDRRQQVALNNSLIASRYDSGQPVGNMNVMSPSGELIGMPSFEEYAEMNGGRAYAMGYLSPEQEQELRQQYDDEVEVMVQAAKVASLSPRAQEAIRNPLILDKYTNTEAGKIIDEMANAGIDTTAIIKKEKRTLPITQVDSLNQANQVMGDVEKLYQMLQDLPGTGPVSGRLQALDPFHPKRVAVDAQITRIVPGLARGIFGEVGVLTDADIERYRNTIANPNQTDLQIEQLHADTVEKINRSISAAIDGFDRAGYDVSGFLEEAPASENPDDPLGLGLNE